jgi:hypothetical protein
MFEGNHFLLGNGGEEILQPAVILHPLEPINDFPDGNDR